MLQTIDQDFSDGGRQVFPYDWKKLTAGQRRKQQWPWKMDIDEKTAAAMAGRYGVDQIRTMIWFRREVEELMHSGVQIVAFWQKEVSKEVGLIIAKEM